MAEVWIGIIERQALHRADVSSVVELNKRIPAPVTARNDRCRPFVLAKISAGILYRGGRVVTGLDEVGPAGLWRSPARLTPGIPRLPHEDAVSPREPAQP